MHNFQERRMPARERELLAAAVRVALVLTGADGYEATTLTRIAERIELPGEQRVSERTLRRRYGSTAQLLFGSPWWLPEPVDAVRAVLAPRPERTEGPVWPPGCERDDIDIDRDDAGGGIDGAGEHFDWPPAEFFTERGIADPLGPLPRRSPEPIALRDLLHDLHQVLTGHVIATGFASNLPRLLALRAEHPEIAAWRSLAESAWADDLATVLATLFGLAPITARAAAQCFQVGAHELEPLVGELAVAELNAQRRDGQAADSAAAETALDRARAAAFDLVALALSEPDRIRASGRRGTVRPGGRFTRLPNRPPASGSVSG